MKALVELGFSFNHRCGSMIHQENMSRWFLSMKLSCYLDWAAGNSERMGFLWRYQLSLARARKFNAHRVVDILVNAIMIDLPGGILSHSELT